MGLFGAKLVGYCPSAAFLNKQTDTTLSDVNLTLVAIKLLGGSNWSTIVPVTGAIPYFPAPFVALPSGLAEQVDHEDAEWRVNGQRAVIHAWLPSSPV